MEWVFVFTFLIAVLSAGAQDVDSAGEVMRHEAQIEETTSKRVPEVPQRPCRYADGPPIQRDLTGPPAPVTATGRDTEKTRALADE